MSTGGRVFPSITGGGLTSAAQAFLDQQMANRAAAQRDRQIDIADQAQSLNQLTVLSSFLAPGTTVGDLGQAGMDLFSRAFSVDPAGLESLELKPETFQTALDTRRIDILDTPEFADLLLPSTRAALGLEPSEDVAATRDLEAQMRFNSLTEILRNPEFTAEFTARALGREPINLRIPGVPGEIEFESTTAANIYAQFLLAREQFGFRLQMEDGDSLSSLITEVQDAVRLAGQSVSSTAMQRVLGVYNQAVEQGDVTPISEFINNPQVTEGEQLALRFLLGSIGAGEDAFLDGLPPQLANFIRMGQAVRDVLGPEDTEDIMRNITEALGSDFAGSLTRGRFGFGPLNLDFSGGISVPGVDPGEGVDPGFDVRQVPEQILIEEIQRSLSDGTSSREELIGLLGEDLVNRAVPSEAPAVAAESVLDPAAVEAMQVPEGGIQPSSVPSPFRGDVQRLNTLIRQMERVTGDVARQNMQNVIDRLRARINAGMKTGA